MFAEWELGFPGIIRSKGLGSDEQYRALARPLHVAAQMVQTAGVNPLESVHVLVPNPRNSVSNLCIESANLGMVHEWPRGVTFIGTGGICLTCAFEGRILDMVQWSLCRTAIDPPSCVVHSQYQYWCIRALRRAR